MSTTAIDPELALTPEGFAVLQEDLLRGQRKVWPASSFAPSLLGHPCDRYLVWRFNRWEEEIPIDPIRVSIFEQGDDCQPFVYRRLERMGFEIVREHDRPTEYKVAGGRARIRGRSDGKIIGFRGERFRPARVLEAKAVVQWTWEKINTVEDVRRASSHWTRGYYAQATIYGFLENLERGVFAFYNKATGMLKIIPFELDYAYAEELLKRVELLAPQVEQGVDPEPLTWDRGICGGCGFRPICYPAKSFGAGATVITDPILVEDIAHREELRAAAKTFDELDASIKDRLKLLGISWAIAGDFMVEGKVNAAGVVSYFIRRAA